MFVYAIYEDENNSRTKNKGLHNDVRYSDRRLRFIYSRNVNYSNDVYYPRKNLN